MKKLCTTMLLVLACTGSMLAANVKVVMNSTSKTMGLTDKTTGQTVETGEPDKLNYTFEAPAGTYVLTAYAADGETVNGTIEINVTDGSEEEQEFTVLTNTVYATNKNEDNTAWNVDEDYTIEVTVNTREGVEQTVTLGNSTTAGRKTFLALNGNSYYTSLVPNKAHQAEGYMTLYKAGTLTFGVNINGKIPMGGDYTISIPAEAGLYLGIKFAHFTSFQEVAPVKTETDGGTKMLTFRLADSQVYNFRTWKEGGLTQGGYFTMTLDESKRPDISFTDADYEAFGPKTIKHDVTWNGGYETGDIFVNINERGHLKMNVGDVYEAHAMRTWQLTDNSTNNYFIEPDFHYTVVGPDGKPSVGVIEIDNPDTGINPWSNIKAVGKGTAIVLVTYDAIGLNYYSGTSKSSYLGGKYWSAIWPENTAVYVVTVGDNPTEMKPNMTINEEYNEDMKKVAGKNVDAEHDVFYYLDTENGATYTFAPDGVADVELAYPAIGERSVTFSGFGTEGVTKNEDGSYTLLLKEGRQIVRLTDATGNAVYQVLTAKPCHREIVNASREGSNIFQPGDKIKIQYSGLRHPANKLAGIYNMSAYVTYNGVPNGSSLILGAGQYTFGSAPSAQAVTVDIPTDYDVENNPEIVMNEGVIQVNGYGDPIGNHRLISRLAGRSANFTAIAHKTYFGQIPEVRIPMTAVKTFLIRMLGMVDGAECTVTYNGNEIAANEDGTYSGTYGTYSIKAVKNGYRCFRGTFTIGDDAEGEQTFNINMIVAADNAWDGTSTAEPAVTDSVYRIGTGAELAWYAAEVNGGNNEIKATVTADIDLGDFDWTPIGGGSAAKAYKGAFDGQGHTVSGLYINDGTATYQGLFGYLVDASVTGLTVEGRVTAKSNVGGVAAYLGANSTIDRCANKADVTASGNYAGGIAANTIGTAKITNSYNTGNITGVKYCAGIAGNATATVENCFSIGDIKGDNAAACLNGSQLKEENIRNVFAIKEYDVTTGHTLVTEKQMASGEVTYLLGEAFGQKLGEDAYPVIGGMKVYVTANNEYTNEAPTAIYDIYEGASATSVNGIYTINGIRTAGLQPGMNIIRMGNGTTKKIVVK